MNVNQKIIDALAPLNIPVYAGFMDAEVERAAGRPIPTDYIAFSYDESPVIYGDDDDLYAECSITIDYFTPGNPLRTKKAIRRLLRCADFAITDTPQEFYENDTKLHHIVINAELFVAVDDSDDETEG